MNLNRRIHGVIIQLLHPYSQIVASVNRAQRRCWGWGSPWARREAPGALWARQTGEQLSPLCLWCNHSIAEGLGFTGPSHNLRTLLDGFLKDLQRRLNLLVERNLHKYHHR